MPPAGSVKNPTANSAIGAGRRRRRSKSTGREARVEWRIEEVSTKIEMTMKQRMTLVTQLLKDRVVRNISTPVVKGIGPRGGRVITGRSKPGEYPHAETEQLIRTIFSDVKQWKSGIIDGYVGTPLDYGLILETRMQRSFLVRTLYEMTENIRKILMGPIK